MNTRNTITTFAAIGILSLFGAQTALAGVRDLDVRIVFDDNTANVKISYEDSDGDNYSERFTWENMDDLEEVFEKIERNTEADADDIERVADIDSDGSEYKGEARESIDDAYELFDTVNDAIKEAKDSRAVSSSDTDASYAALTKAKTILRKAEKFYDAADYEDADDLAEEAEEKAETVFDILDVDEKLYIDKTENERRSLAQKEIRKALSMYEDAIREKNKARSAKLDTDKAVLLLADAFKQYKQAKDAYDEGQIVSAITLAQKSQDTSEEVEDALPAIDTDEDEDKDRIELKSKNSFVSKKQKDVETYISNAEKVVERAATKVKEMRSNLRDIDYEAARDKVRKAEQRIEKAERYFDERDYEEARESAADAIYIIEGKTGVYKIMNLTAPKMEHTSDSGSELYETTTTATEVKNNTGNGSTNEELQKRIHELLQLLVKLLAQKSALEAAGN